MAAIGATIPATAFFAHFVGGTGPIPGVTRSIELALVTLFCLPVVFVGQTLRRGRDVGRPTGDVVAWCVSLSLGLAGLAIVVVLVQARVGGNTVEAVFVLLLHAAAGAALGTVTGLQRATLRDKTGEIRAQRRALSVLNKLVRHHVLNAVQAIQASARALTVEFDHDAEADFELVDRQSDRIVDHVSNVRLLCETVTGDRPAGTIDVQCELETVFQSVQEEFPPCTFETDIQDDLRARGNEAFGVGVELVLASLVAGHSSDEPVVEVVTERTSDAVRILIRSAGASVDEPDSIQDVDRSVDPTELETLVLDTVVRAYDGALELEPDESTLVISLPAGA